MATTVACRRGPATRCSRCCTRSRRRGAPTPSATVDDWGPSGTPRRPVRRRPGRRRGGARTAARGRASASCRRRAAPSGPTPRSSWWSIRSTARPTPSRGIPWYATSLCAVDADGPIASLVLNLAIGRPVRGDPLGRGRDRDGVPLAPGGSGCTSICDAVLGAVRPPPRHLGWAQFRALGASALDLCAVADGTLDGFIDCSPNAHGVWDYRGPAGVPGVRDRRRRRARARSCSCSTTRPGAHRSPPPPRNCS